MERKDVTRKEEPAVEESAARLSEATNAEHKEEKAVEVPTRASKKGLQQRSKDRDEAPSKLKFEIRKVGNSAQQVRKSIV